MEMGHRGKAYYCRDWAFEKLKTCLNKRPTSSTCGTLVMGEGGCGKTALCTELVWPTRENPCQAELSNRLLAFHFCSANNFESVSLVHFLHHLSLQISTNDVIGEQFSHLAHPVSTPSDITDPDMYMVSRILSPLNQLEITPKQVLFVLVDGLDECESGPAVNSISHTIPQLLSKHHSHFPHWLALVCTCSTKAKRVSRLFTGFRKLAIDDITRSHVIQDIQQYILHRLDADASLRKHLDKDMAEVLDKLHVKCNGCILYIELILDMVSLGTVQLRQVDDIPATLGGLYMWICQRLYTDMTRYEEIARPLFSILLATRKPVSLQVVFNSLLTRNRCLQMEDFLMCVKQLSPILLSFRDDGVVFSHPSFRLWLQDVKFCSRTYLCNVREGHELLTLYYTIIASSLTSQDICEFAFHIQRSNTLLYTSNEHQLTSDVGGRQLTIHEQAVWVLLSQAKLQSPDIAMNASTADSLIMDNSMAMSAMDDLKLMVDSNISETPSKAKPASEDDRKSADDISTEICQSNTSTNKHPHSNDLMQTPADTCQSKADTSSNLENCQAVMTNVTDSNEIVAVNKDDDEPDELECLDEEVEQQSVDDVAGSYVGSFASLDRQHPVEVKVSHVRSSTLEEALENNDLDFLEAAIGSGLDVNIPDRDGRLPLVYASAQGHIEMVEMLILMAGAEVNLPDLQQRTALEVACCGGHDSIVSMLLNNNAHVNAPDRCGGTPLLTACAGSHSAVVGQLLANGADVNSRLPNGQTALCVACSHGSGDSASTNHIRMVQWLIQSNSDINAEDGKLQTPLHHASLSGNLDTCDLLITANATVDAVDEFQWTPLLCAVSQGHSQVVDMLIASEADVHHLDQDGRTSLGLACLAGHEAIVRTFLEMGQDEMHRDNNGVDCLHFAAMEGHTKVANMLLNYGADVNSCDDQGRTALLLAAQHGWPDVLEVLLSHGADVNLAAHNGKTALRAACVAGHCNSVDILLRHGADVHHIDMEHRAIIYVLALEDSPQCIHQVTQAGADPNAADDQGRTALHVACWQGHDEVVMTLLDLDIVVDAKDIERRTPLQSAAWQGHAQISEMLCRKGANVNHMCNQGATPLCIAAQEGFLDVVAVLCNYGADPNHADKFGRTALKIAMKANHQQMLHLIENIMRRSKPSNHTPETSRQRRSAVSGPNDPVYENHTANSSGRSETSSVELVAPYAVVSLPREAHYRKLPSLSQRHLHSSSHSPQYNESYQFHPPPNNNTKSAAESELHKSAAEFRRLQAAANARQQQFTQSANVTVHNHPADGSNVQPHANSARSTENVGQGSCKVSSQSSSQYRLPGHPRQRLSAEVSSRNSEMSDTSDGCDTAPSTQSSARGDNSSPESDYSDSQGRSKVEESFTHQIVQLGNRNEHNSGGNVAQVLSGEVGYMANPRINKALYNASQIAAGNIVPPTEHVPMVRSPNRNGNPLVGSKLPRQQSKQSSKKKMTAVQNTARIPTYKVQYAAADHPQLPANYAVRNDELMSAEHSLSSVKSRQAKIVSSAGTRALADSMSFTSSQESSRCSPPPVLPPRKGRASQPLHQSVSQTNKPTLVGVVRPRAQCPEDEQKRAMRQNVSSRFGTGQKETSL